MAHKKGLGSSRNGRDSESKRLGVKIFAGQPVKTGMIIVRQRGTKFRPGPGAGLGRDDTIFALREGTVRVQSLRREALRLGLGRLTRFTTEQPCTSQPAAEATARSASGVRSTSRRAGPTAGTAAAAGTWSSLRIPRFATCRRSAVSSGCAGRTAAAGVGAASTARTARPRRSASRSARRSWTAPAASSPI